jgi:hypothetical protein
MFLEILGIIHIIYRPILIAFPFIVINQKSDIYYISYFFFICLAQTFINGDYSISYVSRILKDKYFPERTCENKIYFPERTCENKIYFPERTCENKIYFPEIEAVLPIYLYPYINLYFIITSKIYFCALSFVVYRNDLFNIIMIPFSVLFFYYLMFFLLYFFPNKIAGHTKQSFIGKHLNLHLFTYFKLYQQFTKVIMIFTIFFLLESQIVIPMNFVARHLRNECIN